MSLGDYRSPTRTEIDYYTTIIAPKRFKYLYYARFVNYALTVMVLLLALGLCKLELIPIAIGFSLLNVFPRLKRDYALSQAIMQGQFGVCELSSLVMTGDTVVCYPKHLANGTSFAFPIEHTESGLVLGYTAPYPSRKAYNQAAILFFGDHTDLKNNSAVLRIQLKGNVRHCIVPKCCTQERKVKNETEF